MSFDFKSTEWGGKFEWPQEVVGFLEFWTAGDNLVDEVLNAGDSVFTELSFNDAVVGDWESSSLDLTATSLVDKLGDGLSGWVTISDEWLDHLDHVPGGFVQFDKNGVVQLSQSEELQDFLWLWSKLSDTRAKQKLEKHVKKWMNSYYRNNN